ncbi:MAG TPA: hypothetical protein VN930_09690, partial [Xanthobacteraceae bacterium]|nr:hypothetical protein [Xanthobacteraceae bacterium]
MSEERIVPSEAEFEAAASPATVLATNVLQGLLVACVVGWILDLPRFLFNFSLYTEQFLTVCLGLSLALAFIADSIRPRQWFDWTAAAASLCICGYVAVRYPELTNEMALLPLEGIVGSAIL